MLDSKSALSRKDSAKAPNHSPHVEELEKMEEDSKEKFEREQRLRERQRVQETLGTLRPD